MSEFVNNISDEIATKLANYMVQDTLPAPDTVTYYVFEKERKIFLDSDIADDTIEIAKMIMRWNMEDKGLPPERRRPIWLYIMCYGGDLDYTWNMCDAIKTSDTPVYTVNLGVAASGASLIFISGRKRFMLPTAKVLVHEGSAEVKGDAVKVMDATDSYKLALRKMKEYILAHTKIPARLLNRKRNNDWEIDAATCLEMGVCDEIVTSLDTIL